MNLAYVIGRNIIGVQGYNICPMILSLIITKNLNKSIYKNIQLLINIL